MCAAPSCTDGVRNGFESCVDGGGSCSTKCPSGASCVSGGDCASGVCGASGLCAAPSCFDKVRNGVEAGVDCGSAASGCSVCGLGAACALDGDCASQYCAPATKVCSLRQSCQDGVLSGDETGVDCGGVTSGCGPCGVNASCLRASACASGLCDVSTRTCRASRYSTGLATMHAHVYRSRDDCVFTETSSSGPFGKV